MEKKNEQSEKPKTNTPVDEKDSAGVSSLDMAIVNERYGSESAAKIRELRTRTDSFYLTAEMLRKSTSSRALSLAVTCFQSARQMSGVILGERGSKDPYPDNANVAKETIYPVSDRGSVLTEILTQSNEILRLKQFRTLVEDAITELIIYMDKVPHVSVKDFACTNKFLTELISAKMWLGERLGEIRDQTANTQ